jgi:hypothetical protein
MMMKRTLSIAALLLGCATGMAQADDVPKGWFVSGSAPAEYTFGTGHLAGTNGAKSAFIRAKDMPKHQGFGTLMQQFLADPYREKRIRLTAWLKSNDAGRGAQNGGAALWMRIDGFDDKQLALYNMNDRQITGTTDWQKVTIVLDVPKEARNVALGVFLMGSGEIWMDDFKLETVGKDVPLSPISSRFAKAPANLGFDQ